MGVSSLFQGWNPAGEVITHGFMSRLEH